MVAEYLIHWTIIAIMLESIMVLLMVAMISLFANNILTVLMAISFYIAGHAVEQTKLTSFVENSLMLRYFLDFYHLVFPAFYKLNLKDFVLYEQTLPEGYLITMLLYGVCYSLFLGIIGSISFEYKNLD